MVALRTPDDLPPPEADGLPVHSVKAHSADKLFYWTRICHMFATATSDKWRGRRSCIDLHCSYGINYDEGLGQLAWGSGLIALQVGLPFDNYILGDIERRATQVLTKRVERLAISGNEIFELDLGDEHLMAKAQRIKGVRAPIKTTIITGDANDAPVPVQLLLPAFPRQRVSLTMLDPYGASFRWASLANLTLYEAMDVLLLFPEDMDLERNLQHEERLDAYMGTPEWRARIAQNPFHRGLALRELYEERLALILGYRLGDAKVIRNSRNAPIYKLLFASKHERGLELWNDGCRTTPDGQIGMYLGREFL